MVIIAVVCLGVALSYPIRYRQAQEENDTNMEELAQMRQRARQSQLDGLQGGQILTGQTLPRMGSDVQTESGPAPADGGGADVPQGQADALEEEDRGASQQPGVSEGASEAAGDTADFAGGADTREQAGNPPEADSGEGTAEQRPSESGGEAVEQRPSESGGEAAEQRPSDSGGEAAEQKPTEGSGGTAEQRPTESDGNETLPTEPEAPTPKPTPTPEPTREPNYWDLGKYYAATPVPAPTPRRRAGPTVEPTPTPDRSIRSGPLPYGLKEKVTLDKAAILPELKDIYALNNDLVGWINIPDTVIDYPVVQAEDGEYYLSHDFYGEENINGQIILDALCDPYTPSYNLIVSGHHMKNGSMFGGLPQYRTKSYWESHRFLELDTLMERKVYVIFACFYSADYDEDETGFRYNAIIDYKIDADRWLEEIAQNQLYDTGIEREFGDEFVTLTTCDRARHRNGRFVVVGRKIREGETFE